MTFGFDPEIRKVLEIHRQPPSPRTTDDPASTLPPRREPPTSAPESPSPWLNSSTSRSRAAQTAEAKQKAWEEQQSASMTGHVNQMLGECHNLPFLFPNDLEHRDVPDNPETMEQRCFNWPNDLIDRIKQVMGSSCATPSPPEFKFEMTEEATQSQESLSRQRPRNSLVCTSASGAPET